VLQKGGFDYWESGMDMRLGEDLFESFATYQTHLLEQFDHLAKEYHFQVLDASQPVASLLDRLKQRILPLLADRDIPDGFCQNSEEDLS
jgi:dTMP kinase